MLESVTSGIAATALATILVWSDFNQTRLTTWLFVAMLIGALASAVYLRIAMDRRRA